jgi:iron complex outermembrane receptor protein
VVGWTDTASSYTQELDFLSPAGSKLDWIFGGFFLNNKTTALTEEFEGTANPNLTPAVLVPLPNIETKPPGNLAYGNTTADTHVSASGFGRLTYHITPQWSVAAGARINYDRSAHDAYNFSEFDIDTVGRAFSSSVATWKFFTAYDITPSNSVYAWVARGYKPGGVNGTYGQVVIPAVFQPETNDGFEVGSKNFFLDHTLQLNIAAYYYLYKNFQYIEQDPVPFDGGMSNIPNIHNYGAEFEAKYRSEDGKLHLDGSIALEDGKVIGNYYTIDSTVQAKIENGTGPCAYGGQYYNPACWNAVIASARNINGKTPPAMPKESGSLSAAYDYTTQWGMLTPRATVIYRGQEWARIFNEPALDNVPAYTQLNLTVTFVPTRSNFKFMLTSTNVTNVAGINSQYTDPYGTGQTSRQYIRPRQVIGTVAYSF